MTDSFLLNSGMYRQSVDIIARLNLSPAPNSYKRTRSISRSIDDRVLLILKHNLTIMLFLSLFLSLDFIGLRCLYRGNISSINDRNRWRLELRLTHRLLRRAVSFTFCGRIPSTLLWMFCIEFVHFSLDESFCVGDLLLDAIFISWQQFPRFVILGNLANEYLESSERHTSFGSAFVDRNCAMASILACRIRICKKSKQRPKLQTVILLTESSSNLICSPFRIAFKLASFSALRTSSAAFCCLAFSCCRFSISRRLFCWPLGVL
jgi:hypothetical protein